MGSGLIWNLHLCCLKTSVSTAKCIKLPCFNLSVTDSVSAQKVVERNCHKAFGHFNQRYLMWLKVANISLSAFRQHNHVCTPTTAVVNLGQFSLWVFPFGSKFGYGWTTKHQSITKTNIEVLDLHKCNSLIIGTPWLKKFVGSWYASIHIVPTLSNERWQIAFNVLMESHVMWRSRKVGWCANTRYAK